MKPTHVSDELPRLLSGEASRDVVLDAADHLRTCVDCQQELVAAVVAHAALTSAHRFAPEVMTDPSRGAAMEPAASLPDLSAVFAQAREEAAAPEVPEAPTALAARRAARRPRYLLSAAAAVVVLGAGAITVAALTSDNATAGRTVALNAVAPGSDDASVTLAGDQMKIDASSLPRLAGSHYEVWLANGDGSQKVPIGWIDPDGNAQMRVPGGLMDQYSAIVVSVQDDGSYVFSGVSVLRGDYA